jgi:hypothetical protein
MSDSLKSIEALIDKARSLLLDKAYDTPATRNNLRLLEEQRQNILDGRRVRNIDGVLITSKLIKGKRVATSAGGFASDDRVISLALTLELGQIGFENSIAKKSEDAKKNQELSKNKRKDNTKERYKKAMEAVIEALGTLQDMTHEEFEFKFNGIKPRPKIPLPRAKQLIQKTILLKKVRKAKS